MSTLAATSPLSATLDPVRAAKLVGRVHRAALRLTRSPHDADDLTQETFVKVLARPRVIREGDELGYLLGALRNVHRSALRTATRRPCAPVTAERLEALPSRRADPHAAATNRAVTRAIAELPKGQCDVVVAVDLLGLSYAEAAAALRIPGGTVMSRLHRGRATVARCEGSR